MHISLISQCYYRCYYEKMRISYSVPIMFLLMLFVSQNYGQTDYVMLLENCGWKGYYDVSSISFNLTTPNRTLSANLVCKTSFIVIKNPAADQNYKIKVKVYHFDLRGPSSCVPYSERLIFRLRNYNYGDIVWCGQTYAEEMIIANDPSISPYAELMVEYKIGYYGLGTGFVIQFSNGANEPVNQNLELMVLPTPKLLYSPFYPMYNVRYGIFSVTFRAPANTSMLLSLWDMNVESDAGCRWDSALVIEGEPYCGNKSLNVYLPSQLVRLAMDARNLDKHNFVLRYSSVKLERYQCVNKENYSIFATEQETFLNINVDNKHLQKCVFDVQASSDSMVLKVLKVTVSNWDNILVYDNNSMVNLSNVEYYCSRSRSVSIIINPSITLGNLMRSVNVTVQAVDKVWLPPVILNNSEALIWITAKLMTNQKVLQFSSDQALVFKTFNSNLQPQPVSNYLSLFNGPGAIYFELTRDCNGNFMKDLDISSLNSTIVTASLLGPGDSTEFLLSVSTKDPVQVKVPTTPLLSSQFTFRNYSLKFKNLYCHWEIQSSQTLPLIKFKAQNNFPLASNSLMVVLGSNETLAIYNQFTSADLWLMSRTDLLVDVVVVADDSFNPALNFTYEYSSLTGYEENCDLNLSTSLERHFASTPNYPNFYPRLIQCTWRIFKSSATVGSSIFLIFPAVLRAVCQQGNMLTVRPAFQSEINLCDFPTNANSFLESSLTVTFTAQGLVQPGFGFSYWHVEPQKITCPYNLTMDEDIMYTLKDSGSDSMIGDCVFYLYPRSYDSQIVIFIDLEFISPNFLTVYSMGAAGADNMAEWKQILRLDSQNNKRGIFTYPSTSMKVLVSWFLMLTSFQVNIKMSRASCSDNAELTADTDIKYLSSPNYPMIHQPMTCLWHLTSSQGNIVLEFLDLSLSATSVPSCNSAYLAIYNGSYASGNLISSYCYQLSRKTLLTATKEVTIVYRSNSVSIGPFWLKFYTLPDAFLLTPKSSNDSDSVTLIAVSVIVSALIILVLAVVVLCKVTRTKCCRSRSTREPVINFDRRASRIFMFDTNTPPPYINPMLTPPPYSEVARSDERNSLELPPPYSVTQPADVSCSDLHASGDLGDDLIYSNPEAGQVIAESSRPDAEVHLGQRRITGHRPYVPAAMSRPNGEASSSASVRPAPSHRKGPTNKNNTLGDL